MPRVAVVPSARRDPYILNPGLKGGGPHTSFEPNVDGPGCYPAALNYCIIEGRPTCYVGDAPKLERGE